MRRSLLVILFAITPLVQAQTPQQMEYERQQREYRQQMERQQEQQRQQQKIQDENARRQQEETRRANTPPPANPSYSQPGPAPSYQGPGSVGRESGVLQPRSNLKGGPSPPAPAIAGPATLSLNANAIGGTSLLVLRKSIETVLSEAGIAGKSSFKTWAQACETGTPVCSVGQNALLGATVAAAKTDNGGNGRTAAIPAGTYYVFGRASANAMWNVKVELKPGDNKVSLDARNVTLLD